MLHFQIKCLCVYSIVKKQQRQYTISCCCCSRLLLCYHQNPSMTRCVLNAPIDYSEGHIPFINFGPMREKRVRKLEWKQCLDITRHINTRCKIDKDEQRRLENFVFKLISMLMNSQRRERVAQRATPTDSAWNSGWQASWWSRKGVGTRSSRLDLLN